MQRKTNLRSQKVGKDRPDFDMEAEVVAVRIERSIKDRVIEAATVAMITIVATMVATLACTWILA
jgi:hypothetical protein